MITCEQYITWWQTFWMVVGTILGAGVVVSMIWGVTVSMIYWTVDKIWPDDDDNPPTPPKKPKKNKQSTPELLEYGAYTYNGGVVKKVERKDN